MIIKNMIAEWGKDFTSLSKFVKCPCIFFFFIFICFSLPINAATYWGDGVFADFGFSSKSSFPSQVPLEGTVGIRKTFDEAALFAGGGVDDFGLSIAGFVQATPLRVNFFSLGFKYLTNLTRSFVFENRPDLITWGNVFLLTTSFALGKDKNNPFVIHHNVGINVHKSFLQLAYDRLELHELSMSLELQLIKRFLNRHEIMFRLATFDTFILKDFVNLWWQLGYSFDINDRFTLGGLAEVVYTDQVFLSGAVSGVQAKLFGVYKF